MAEKQQKLLRTTWDAVECVAPFKENNDYPAGYMSHPFNLKFNKGMQQVPLCPKFTCCEGKEIKVTYLHLLTFPRAEIHLEMQPVVFCPSTTVPNNPQCFGLILT